MASVADATAAAEDARLEYHSQTAFANLTTELHWVRVVCRCPLL